MDAKIIGSYLRDKRLRNSYTQVELSEILGVTHQAISRWETGESIPDVTMLDRLSILYKVTIDDIVNSDQENEVEISDNDKSKPIDYFTLTFSIIIAVLSLILIIIGGASRVIPLLIIPSFCIGLFTSIYSGLSLNHFDTNRNYGKMLLVSTVSSFIFLILSIIILISGLVGEYIDVWGIIQPILYGSMTVGYYVSLRNYNTVTKVEPIPIIIFTSSIKKHRIIILHILSLLFPIFFAIKIFEDYHFDDGLATIVLLLLNIVFLVTLVIRVVIFFLKKNVRTINLINAISIMISMNLFFLSVLIDYWGSEYFLEGFFGFINLLFMSSTLLLGYTSIKMFKVRGVKL